MRISLVIYDLGCGGAQRVMTRLAEHLARSGHDTTLFSMTGGEPFFEIDHGVRVVDIGGVTPQGSGIISRCVFFLKRFVYIRKRILEAGPDVVISFVDEMNVRTLAALIGSGKPVIVSEHTYPPNHKIKKVYDILRRLLYPGAAAVVVLTEKSRLWAEGWIKKERLWTIANPVIVPSSQGPAELPLPDGKKLLGMGRLSREKGFDMLIEAFARVAVKHSEWSLVIVGAGAELEPLRKLAADLGIEGRVAFPGFARDGFSVMRACDAFALSSRLEGFPVTLCEAMSCGLPPVCFNCDTGPADIIDDGANGILVPPGDVDAFASALDKIMGDNELRSRLAEGAKKISSVYSKERIMGQWDQLIEKTASRGASRR